MHALSFPSSPLHYRLWRRRFPRCRYRSLLLDWLTPVDFDGAAHVSLKESDPRLKLEALMTWELKNLLELLNLVSRHLLLPLQGLLAQSEARDKLARLTQYTLLMANGLIVALGGQSSAR